jgi:hypothetical protein
MGHGLPLGQDQQAQLVGLDLVAVDPPIHLYGSFCQIRVLVDYRLNRPGDHLLHSAGHQQQAIPQLAKLRGVLPVRVLSDHGSLPYPNLPVM